MGIQVLESLLVYMLNPTVAKVQVLQVGQSCRQNTRFTYLLIISSERERHQLALELIGSQLIYLIVG